jgi:urease accessory protein
MRRILPALFLLLPTAAAAHTGLGAHGAPVAAGLAHPFLGPDHMLAMLAVGLFAATTGGRALWAYPAGFLAAMVAGGFLGFGGAGLPVVEPTILASAVVLGTAIALALRPPLGLACGAIALFGLAHGYAHGLEGPALGGLPYAAGFVLATATLHALGLGLGLAAAALHKPVAARVLGGLAALAGLLVAAG